MKSAAGLYSLQNIPVFCPFYLKNHSIAVSVIGYGKILLISSHKSCSGQTFNFIIAIYCMHTGISCKYMLHISKIVNKYI